jgi:thymidylate synthase
MENNLDKQYTDLLQDILDNGVTKQTRNGGTISVFGRTIRYKFKDGKFPLITTKKMAWKSIVTELLWFLRGDTNIKFLVDNGCHIWDGDCYSNYIKKNNGVYNPQTFIPEYVINGKVSKLLTKEEFINKIKTDDDFAKKWGDLGPVYGQMWRDWDTDTGEKIDQIANLINDLKTNPDGRRLMVSAWNPTYIPHCVLPPCHYGFQVYTRELSWVERREIYLKILAKNSLWKDNHSPQFSVEDMNNVNIPTRAISLMWNQRSCDVPLGIPMNIASYGLLLMMIAKQVNMIPEELIGNFGDAHIYLNQVEGIKEQLTREPYELPTVKISDRVVNDISEYTLDDIILENYQSHPAIKMPLSN